MLTFISYLTVDYERSTFQVAQAKWIPNATQNLTAILTREAATPSEVASPSKSNKLSTGAMIGIIVGTVCLSLLLLGAGVYWFFWARKKRRGDEIVDETLTGEKVEFEDTSPPKPNELQGDSTGLGEVEGDGTYFRPNKIKHGVEVEGSPAPDSDRVEAPGTPGGVEMEGSRGGAEMEGSGVPKMESRGHREVFELPAGDYSLAGTGGERRNPSRSSRSPIRPEIASHIWSPRSRRSPQNSANTSTPASPQQSDRRRERTRTEGSGRWSWRRSGIDGEPF